MKIRSMALAAAGMLAGPAAVSATELGRLDIGAPGAMISVCGGMGGSGAIGDKGGWQAGQFECNAQQTASPSTTVAQAASYTVGGPTPVDTSAHGDTVMGQTRLYAHFVSSNGTTGYSQAAATGGWVDTLTLTPVDPADIGKTASLTFAIDMSGTLQAVPSGNGFAAFGVQPYIDDNAFVGNQRFQVSGQGQYNFPYDQTVDQITTFTTDITLGTAFELGVFARAWAGTASYSPGSDFISGGTVDFMNTVSWAGITAVTLNGNALAYTLASASGIDWTQPFTSPVPEPGTWALWASGLLGIGVLRRR
jgi:MYXO-CTERM domain-containing protein